MKMWDDENSATMAIVEILIRTELALIEYSSVMGLPEINSVIGIIESITNRDLSELERMFTDAFDSYEFSRSDLLEYIFEQPKIKSQIHLAE